MTETNWLKKIYRGWMKFAHGIGKINSVVILSLLWMLLIGAYALVFKLIIYFSKKDTHDTFWKEKVDGPKNIQSVTQQF